MDPWFKFYASDYLLDAGVDSLPLEAQAILVRLWCLVWRDQFLKDDPDTLARRAVVDVRAMRKHWPALRSFFIETPDGLVSDRMEKERTESRATSESRRLGAQKTNEKRWGKRVAEVSPTDRSAIAQRPIERVAEVSLSESESDTEITTPLPPTGSGDGIKPVRKAGWLKAHPAEVIQATKEIKALWPRPEDDAFQPDGKTLVPGVSPSELASRLAEIAALGADLEVCVKIAARVVSEWKAGKWIKAPHHFFGKAKDAPFRAYYQAHVTNEAVRLAS